MRPIKLIVIILLLLAQACGNDAEKENPKASTETKEPVGLSPKKIEQLSYTDYALSAEGENAVADWQKYQQLATQISYLKQGDLSLFNGEREIIMTFVQELQESMPETLNTNPISSRVGVVVTALLKLNDDLVLDNIKTQDQLKSIKQLFVAFANLNFQINKKLERDLFDSIQPE